MKTLTLGIPSKGRLMEQSAELLERAGLAIVRDGSDRGYRGNLSGIENIDVAFLSASEIAQNLKDGKIDFGITGEDLLREKIAPDNDQVLSCLRLEFGNADVVVAIPACWFDVATMVDLEDVAEHFYTTHGRRLRIATKYRNLTRRFFEFHGVTGYRIVESLGATEGAVAAGIAEVIVDITTTGATLTANQLRILDDGVILRSCAVLACSKTSGEEPRFKALLERVRIKLAQR